MKFLYKVDMVKEDEQGHKQTVCLIGYFDSEEKLEKWARENQGELQKEG